MQNRIFIFLLLLCAFPSVSLAFRLSPMVIHFSPTGNKSTQVLTLENPGGEKIPIQMEAFIRTTDAKGNELRTKTDEFVIYPEQLVLLPNEKRNVRITWSGELKDENEKAFRIVASQLPVEFQEKNSKPVAGNDVNLNFLLQYVASAYVTPAGATSNIKVKEIKKTKDGKKVSFVVFNEGSAHRVLRAKVLKIYNGDKVTGQITDLKELDNANLLPKSEKTFQVPYTKELQDKGVRGELVLSETTD